METTEEPALPESWRQERARARGSGRVRSLPSQSSAPRLASARPNPLGLLGLFLLVAGLLGFAPRFLHANP